MTTIDICLDCGRSGRMIAQYGHGWGCSRRTEGPECAKLVIASTLAADKVAPVEHSANLLSEHGMKVYLAGKMTGVPQFNYPAFYKVAARLRAEGHTVFNPAEHDVEVYGPEMHQVAAHSTDGILSVEDKKRLGFDHRQILKADLMWICDHAEAVAVLPGPLGRGGKTEVALAEALDLMIMSIPRHWVK